MALPTYLTAQKAILCEEKKNPETNNPKSDSENSYSKYEEVLEGPKPILYFLFYECKKVLCDKNTYLSLYKSSFNKYKVKKFSVLRRYCSDFSSWYIKQQWSQQLMMSQIQRNVVKSSPNI